ncbi:O-antigen ligase family protein [Rhizobium mesosinicum]|uniref:O-antigen ligase family protein n=1 Tax=Rhizobium mesosinicum TaxID=335017 RepID=A0ABS7H334_9HYPH|nr:O-antigen ligase family protein [Rhizobium mesosinicum]MBW9055963.1 O-antigen ligase family protein [Rhizobium mesosinicum]
MAFRITYIASLILLIFNVGAALHFSGSNAIEKAFFVLAAFAILGRGGADKTILMLLGAELALVFVLAVLTPYEDFSWSIFFVSLNQIIILFALLAGKTGYRDQQAIWKATAILPVICALLGFVYQFAGIKPMVATEFATGVPRYLGSLSAAAFTSALGMCGVFAAMQLVLSGRKAYVVFVLTNLLVLFAAGGRATLAVCVLVTGVSLLIHRGVTITTKLSLIVLGSVGSLAIVAVFWKNFATRFIESGDSGRSVMWDYLRTVIAQYPFTGIGFGHQFYVTPHEIEVMLGSTSAHNDYIRLSVELGTPGMIIFYVLLTMAVLKACFRGRRPNVVAILAYAGYLFLSNSDNAIASPLEFPLIFLALLSRHEKPFPRRLPRAPSIRQMRGERRPVAMASGGS